MSALEFINYLLELPSRGFFFGLKVFFIVLSSLMLIGIIWLLFLTDWYEQRFGADLRDLRQWRSKEKGKLAKLWEKIHQRMRRSKIPEHKLALIEAGEFLAALLERQGFKGKTLLEQLEKAGPDIVPLEKLDEFLKAYEVYRAVTHDPDYQLSLKKARESLAIFERIIKDLTAEGSV